MSQAFPPIPPRPEQPGPIIGYGGISSEPPVLSDAALRSLRGMHPWQMFIGVLCIVLACLCFIGAIGLFWVMTMASRFSVPSEAPLGLVALLYIFLGALQIAAGVLLIKCAGSIKALLQTGFATDVVRAFELQRLFWKFLGITAIVSISLYIAGTAIVVFVTARAPAPTATTFPPRPSTMHSHTTAP